MKYNKKNIILLGLDFNSKNLGCSALAYSFLNILNELAKKNNKKLEIISVNYNDFNLKEKNYEVKNLKIKYKSPLFYIKFIKKVFNSDYVFDFTGGDSFTDIYGKNRFLKESFLKLIVVWCNKKLILGPQTIGPFKSIWMKNIAYSIMKKSKQVYTRDKISFDYVKKMKINAINITDVALMLPNEKVNIEKDNNVLNIGINVSGLLWNGGYTRNNQFGLKFNYQAYIEEIIKIFVNMGAKIYLIGHVLPKEDNSPENDYVICQKIHEQYPETVLAPRFKTPMEAKGYIANMDFFIGSRMHATVAAFSMKVPTVSITYSRKFKGLYGSLGYNYIIDAKEVTLEKAINKTIFYVENRLLLKKDIEKSLLIVHKKNNEFISSLDKIFKKNK